MVGGLLTSLIWMALGLLGFIPRIGVGLLLLPLISMFTSKLSKEHLNQIWGRRKDYQYRLVYTVTAWCQGNAVNWLAPNRSGPSRN